jgi:hypothetical protein
LTAVPPAAYHFPTCAAEKVKRLDNRRRGDNHPDPGHHRALLCVVCLVPHSREHLPCVIHPLTECPPPQTPLPSLLLPPQTPLPSLLLPRQHTVQLGHLCTAPTSSPRRCATSLDSTRRVARWLTHFLPQPPSPPFASLPTPNNRLRARMIEKVMAWMGLTNWWHERQRWVPCISPARQSHPPCQACFSLVFHSWSR